MSSTKIISPAPHLHGPLHTPTIMRDVVIALAPAWAFSVFVYGWQAVWLTALAVGGCMLFEWLICRFLLRRPSSLGDWSAVVTGTLLAFNLPVGISPWLVLLGALVAVGVGKMSFGGLGRNLFNPALVGRVFLLISFPAAMTAFPDTVGVAEGVEAISGATPLEYVKEALKAGVPMTDIMNSLDVGRMFLGFKDGSLGEIGVLALLLGGIYLWIRRVITWHIPVAVLGSMALFATILHGVDPGGHMSAGFHLVTGGAVLGAVFMATDYVTSPMTKRGGIIYGVGIGVITLLIRTWGAYPEGMSFAILIMNAAVPLIDMYLKPSRFGKRSA